MFPFYELRAAAVDLRDPRLCYDHQETVRRCGALLDTCIALNVRCCVLSAFGCGAFRNPATRVARAFREALTAPCHPPGTRPGVRANHMEIVAFGEVGEVARQGWDITDRRFRLTAIFHAGYGPDN